MKINDERERYVAIQYLGLVRKSIREDGMTATQADALASRVAYLASCTSTAMLATSLVDEWMAAEGLATWTRCTDPQDVVIAIDNALGKHDCVFSEEVEAVATF